MAVLEMKHITKSFAGVYANEDIDLSVEKGEIHALLGENGAGKTTLMNILFGIYTADSGEIFWKNEKTSFHSPKDAIANGIGMVHQHFSLVHNMTVLDNIILGLSQNPFFLNRKEAEKNVLELAEKYGLKVNPNARISELSVGEQQRVEILKALYRNVELLILDEPTGVLTPKETEHFFDVLRCLKKEGYAIIIITHRMSEIMAISDRITILRDGKKVISLNTKDTNPEELSTHMIGRELVHNVKNDMNTNREEALVLSHVTVKKGKKRAKLDDINLTVHKGEILGIAGVDGNGQKELAEVIAGIRKKTSGKIHFFQEGIGKLSVRERFEKGISYISDDRHADGLIMDMNVKDNFILRNYKKMPYSKTGVFKPRAIKNDTQEAVLKYEVKTPSLDVPVKILSGGNQQKIILSREISQEAKCIIANQPTRGLDIGATEFVHKTLLEQRSAGKSIILISADLEELLALSDRIAVMFGGKIVGILEQKDATVQKLGLLMGGIAGKEGNHEE